MLSEKLLVLSPYQTIPPPVTLISGNGTFHAAAQATNIGVILDFFLFLFSLHLAHQQVLRMLSQIDPRTDHFLPPCRQPAFSAEDIAIISLPPLVSCKPSRHSTQSGLLIKYKSSIVFPLLKITQGLPVTFSKYSNILTLATRSSLT